MIVLSPKAIRAGGTKQEKIRTVGVAAASAEFVEGIYPVKLTKSQRSVFNRVKAKLGLKARHRRIQSKGNGTPYALQELVAAYSADFGGKNHALRGENRLLWDVFDDI